MFIKYLTNQIPPKKSKGKGSKGKKIAEESQETVDVSEESEPEPEPAKKKTSSKRRVKKKVTLSVDDNIISDDPDAALELAKSISQTEAEEAEAARKVHVKHARIMIESVPESAKKKSGGRSSKSVVIQDTLNIMQALKETKKTSKRQPGTEGSNEGTSSNPRVLDESTVFSATSSEGTGAKPGVPDEEKDITKEKDDKDGDADDEGDDHVSDTQDADDEDDETKSNEDEIYKYKICVHKDKDVEMKDAKVEESNKGEEKVNDAVKEEAKKTSESKDDAKMTELPPSSSSLSVSSGFGDQFLKLSSDSYLVSTVKDSADTDKVPVLVILETTNLPPIPEILTKTPVSIAVSSPQVTPIISSAQQIPTPIPTPPITTKATTIITAIHESNALSVVELRVAKLKKDISKLKTVDHPFEALILTKKPTLTAEQEFEKSPSDFLKIKKEQAEKQKKPQFTIKSNDKAALKEYDPKSALYQSMHANKSFNRNPSNHRLYHALMEALIEDENAMDKGVTDITKRRRTKESKSSKKPSSTKETPKGKAPTKGSKIGKSASAKEPVEETITEVVMDDAGDDVAHDDYQPQDTSKPKTRKTLNPD
ncbi:hypothetical protein Tco_1397054 [Tanacetum coccineum]